MREPIRQPLIGCSRTELKLIPAAAIMFWLLAAKLPVAAAQIRLQAPPPQIPPPAQPAAQQPQPQAAGPAAAPGSSAPATVQAQGASVPIAFHFENADLLQVVGIIASQLSMNYVVDPQVKGSVNINTLGELRREDLFPLLQMILRINGATAVQTGNLYRIVPLQNVQRLPIEPQMNLSAAQIPPDDRIVMNIVPLKFVAAADMTKILTPFLSEGGHLFSHEAGNVLIITDNSRSMKRLMDLLAQFDTEVFSNQRARLYPVKSSQAEKLAAELKEVFSAYGLSKDSAIRFVPIERVNSILVVTANPSVYPEVERWLDKLDQPTSASGVRIFVYKVENGKAADLANVLSQVLLGRSAPPSTAANAQALRPSVGTAGMTGQLFSQSATMAPAASSAPPSSALTPGAGTLPPGIVSSGSSENPESDIRIVPDAINNQLLIQCTAQEFEDMKQTLHDIDVVPRQVMIEAKVFEVDLTGALSAGVTAFLQNQGGAVQLPGGERKLQGSFASPDGTGPAALSATVGTLVGKTRELLLFLNAAETRGQARVVSAPSLLASDNVAASIDVGTQIPTLSSQALVGGTQVSGSNLFTNTIENVDTGVLLTIVPRVNSSGLVNLQIHQEVSSPLPVASTGIQSPSIQKRVVDTQVVVQDGETIALGGIIQESHTLSKSRVPLLGDIPYVGALFGTTSNSTERTELIVLLTPTVIRDVSEAARATTEFRDKLKDLKKLLQQDEDGSKPNQSRDSNGAVTKVMSDK